MLPGDAVAENEVRLPQRGLHRRSALPHEQALWDQAAERSAAAQKPLHLATLPTQAQEPIELQRGPGKETNHQAQKGTQNRQKLSESQRKALGAQGQGRARGPAQAQIEGAASTEGADEAALGRAWCQRKGTLLRGGGVGRGETAGRAGVGRGKS